MKTIPLRELCHQLKKKRFVRIGDYQASITKDVEYVNEPSHIFLDVYWEQDGIPFEVSFATQDNKNVQVDQHGNLKLVSTFGDIEDVSIID